MRARNPDGSYRDWRLPCAIPLAELSLKTFRTIVFWAHLAIGVFVAAVVVIMSATGVLLTYQKQMQYWADTRGLAGGPPTPAAPRLSADSLHARVQTATGTVPTALLIRRPADAPAEITLGRDRKVFVNAYTGVVLGDGSTAMRDFFRSVTSWHRTLAATGERRALGRSLTGAANLGFFFIVVSGLFLWWPRTWTRARLRNIAAFRRGTSGKARDFNWHNTVGVWSFIPLVAVVGSGVVMSYPWANALVYRAVGEQPPAAQPRPVARGSTEGGRRPSPPGVTSALSMDSALAIAASQMPAWRSISIQLPSPSAKTLTASLDAGSGGQPQLRGSLVIDRATANISRWEAFSTQTAGRRLRSILRFAHTGEVLGFTGQTIAGLVSLGSVILAWTGIALALRRLVTWRRRAGRRVEVPQDTPRPEFEPAGALASKPQRRSATAIS